ncbi:MAG TPA: adenine phosphoribosyltransferase [Candidatus Limnocylindrales bacterium]|nr:adenine phosphoribosyltransferase [Candidatus Limnocylindrales bacterium]
MEIIKSKIRDVPDFPKPGILFKDITPVLQDPVAFRATIDRMADRYETSRPDAILAIESRGFILGAALAYRLGIGLAIVRKPKKLPYKKIRVEYSLEYGTDALEAHEDAVTKGQRVVIVDDLLATGGTAGATIQLANKLGATVQECCFVIELGFLEGRKKLAPTPVFSLITY